MAERTALFDIAELFDGVRELTDKARKKTERAMSQAAKLENGFRSYMPFRESTKTFRSYSMEYGKNFHSLLSRWFRGSKVKDVIFTSDLLD